MAELDSGDGETAPRPIGWAVKTMVLAGGPVVALAFALIAPVLPQIEQDLAHGRFDAFLVKQLVVIVLAAQVAGATLTGFLADRIGLRRILILNYVLYTVAGTAGFYIYDLYLLLASRVLLGIGGAGAITCSIIVINTTMAPEKRAGWMGAYISVAMISSVLFQPLAGILAEWDWHWSFLLYGAAAPFILIAAIAFPNAPRSPKVEAKAKGPPLVQWFPFRFAIFGLVLGAITYVPIVYAQYQLRDMGILSPTLRSLVQAGDIVAGSVTALLLGHARRVISEYGAFTFCLLFALLGTLVTALAPNYLVVFIGMALLGMGVSWFMPNLMLSIGSRVAPDQQGRGAGLVKAAIYLGGPIGTTAAEPLYLAYGPRSVMLAVAVLALVPLVLVVHRMVAKQQSWRYRPTVVASPTH